MEFGYHRDENVMSPNDHLGDLVSLKDKTRSRFPAIYILLVHGFNRFEWVSSKKNRKVSNRVRFCLQNNEDILDPYCVEENPQKITFEDITSAAFKIKCGIVNTPCVV